MTLSEMERLKSRALVLEIHGRFFYGFGKSGRTLSSFTLSGARLFGQWEEQEMQHVTLRLREKHYAVERVEVGVLPGAQP